MSFKNQILGHKHKGHIKLSLPQGFYLFVIYFVLLFLDSVESCIKYLHPDFTSCAMEAGIILSHILFYIDFFNQFALSDMFYIMRTIYSMKIVYFQIFIKINDQID